MSNIAANMQAQLEVLRREDPLIQLSIIRYLKMKGIRALNYIESGAFSRVYRVVRDQSCKCYALKVINIKVRRPYTLVHLPMEVWVTIMLSKAEHIIKTFFIARPWDDCVIFVMEYAAYGDVGKWINQNGCYNEDQGRLIFQQVLNGISEMHQLYIAHRDLKVENFLLLEPTKVKIADFSFSTEFDSEETPSVTTYCGTRQYLSPQILAQEAYNPFQSDVWSLGVCLFAMFNGDFPFRTSDHAEMLKWQSENEWDFSEHVANSLSNECLQFVSQMLEPDEGKRANVSKLQLDPWIQTPSANENASQTSEN